MQKNEVISKKVSKDSLYGELIILPLNQVIGGNVYFPVSKSPTAIFGPWGSFSVIQPLFLLFTIEHVLIIFT